MPSLANPDGKGSGLLPLTGSRQARKSHASSLSPPKKKQKTFGINLSWRCGANWRRCADTLLVNLLLPSEGSGQWCEFLGDTDKMQKESD